MDDWDPLQKIDIFHPLDCESFLSWKSKIFKVDFFILKLIQILHLGLEIPNSMIFGWLRSFAKLKIENFQSGFFHSEIDRNTLSRLKNTKFNDFWMIEILCKKIDIFHPLDWESFLSWKSNIFKVDFFILKLIQIRHLGLKLPNTMILLVWDSLQKIDIFHPLDWE